MSTRAVIGRTTPSDVWEGNYHHWDGYPTCLGKTLWDAWHGHFQQDTEKMLHFLMEEHSAGWSSIHDCDWTAEPGFEENGFTTSGPHCYCHGGRHENGMEHWITNLDTDTWCEWAYIFNAKSKKMFVFYRVGEQWKHVRTVNLMGKEPNWEMVEAKGHSF